MSQQAQQGPLVSFAPLDGGAETIKIKYRGRIHEFYYRDEATLNCLGRAISLQLKVPLRYQRLLARGVSLSVTKGSTPKARRLRSLAGKTLLLIGRPSDDVDPLDTPTEASVLYNRQDELGYSPPNPRLEEARTLWFTVANFRYLDKRDRMLDIVNSGPAPPPPILEDATSVEPDVEATVHIRRVDRLVPGLGLALQERFKALLGRGVVPRLNCSHIPTPSLLWGCVSCIQVYFADWYAFALDILAFEIKRAKEIIAANPDQTYEDSLYELEAEAETLVRQYTKGTKLGVNTPLSESIIEWCEVLDVLLAEEGDSIDGETSADIDSFYTAIEILEGGLGQGEYDDEGLSTAPFIINMRG